MKNKKKAVILFGRKNSGKSQFYSLLTKNPEERDLLNYLKPFSLDKQMNIQAFLFNIPEVDSFNDYSEIFLHSLSKFLHTFAYEVIQIACCIKLSDEIINEQEQFVSILSNLFINLNYETITFIINEAAQNQVGKFNFYKNANYIYLSEQDNTYNECLVRKYWTAGQYKNLSLNQFKQLDTHHLFIIKYSELQKSICLDQFSQIQNMAEFLDSIGMVEEQPNFLVDFSQIKDKINIITELLFLIAHLQDKLSQNSEIRTKCSNLQYRENCFMCSTCSIVYSVNREKQYQIISFGKFIITERKLSNKYIDKCYLCGKKSYCVSKAYIEYIISAIINKCISLYYSIKMNESFVLQQSDIKLKILAEIEQNEEKQNSSFNQENRNLQNEVNPNKNIKVPQQNNMDIEETTEILTDSYQIEKNSQQLIFNTTTNNNDSSQEYTKIVSLLISCENNEKSFIFQKLSQSQEQWSRMQNYSQFKQSKLLRGKYIFFDSPGFSFSEEFQQTIVLYREFLSQNEIHFIFLFLDYQRIDLMRKDLNYMLQKLHKVDRQKMALIITNWQKHSEEDEINKILELANQKKISKSIFTNNNDSSLSVQKEIFSCLEHQNSDLISFAGTLFTEQAEETSENIIDYKLLQLGKQIEEKYEKEQNDKLKDLKEQQNMLIKTREEYQKKIEQIDSLNLDLNLQILNIENNIWKLNQAKLIQQRKQNSAFQSISTSII